MTPQDFVAAIPVPCVHVGADGRVSALNAGAIALFGAESRGRHYMTAFRQPALVARFEEAFASAGSSTGRWIGRHAGQETHYEVTLAPLRDADRPAGLIATFLDMTPVEEAGERRSEFVANVSHELRTPLTAIVGFIETLRGPARADPEAQARFLEIMAREAGRMNRLVDDLLSLARVEDTERMRPMENVDVAALLRAAVLGLAPLAEERRVQLSDQGCEAPQWAPGDADQLTQVFSNLLENAIKYGAEGGRVTATLEALEHAQVLGGPALCLAVRDRGEGIDERHLGRLTERFYRVDSHRSRGMGGTGLGLAIVKHIVNRHRGWLRIESTKGQGSTFTVFLPRG